MDPKVAQLNAFLDKNRNLVDKVNTAIMEGKFNQVDNIYIDLACLRDTRLGLMLPYAQDKPELLEYLQKNLPAYNIRPIRQFKYAYPEFPLSESDLNTLYHRPELSEAIFDFSPDTDFMGIFSTFIQQTLFNNNQVGRKGRFGLFVNIYPLHQCEILESFKLLLESITTTEDCHVQFIRKKPSELESSFWARQSVLFLDDLKDVCQENSGLYKPLLVDTSMKKSRIYAAYQVDEDVLQHWLDSEIDLSDEQILAEMFELTQLYFSVCCNFTFIKYQVPEPEEAKEG